MFVQLATWFKSRIPQFLKSTIRTLLEFLLEEWKKAFIGLIGASGALLLITHFMGPEAASKRSFQIWLDSNYQVLVIVSLAVLCFIQWLWLIRLKRFERNELEQNLPANRTNPSNPETNASNHNDQSLTSNFTNEGDVLGGKLGFANQWPKMPNDKSGPWLDVCDEIFREGNRSLLLLGANGDETFGARASPLYDALEQFKGEIRVMLIKPGCPHMNARADDVKVPVIQYIHDIEKSVNRLVNLRAMKVNVKDTAQKVTWRFYKATPAWKLILTDSAAWVQYYRQGTHVHETHVFKFVKSAGKISFYDLIRLEFERTWKGCQWENRSFRDVIEPRGVSQRIRR